MTPPAPERPGIAAGYGISDDAEGLLPWSRIEAALGAARNYWIATTRTDGRPHATPVWGLWFDGAVWFGTDPASIKAANLARDPRVTVHLESGDDVVIVEGVAVPLAPDAVVAKLRDRYLAKYDIDAVGDNPGDGWFRVEPSTAFAWLEASYPTTATRFRFAPD